MINKRLKRVLLILPFFLVIIGIMMLFMPAIAVGNFSVGGNGELAAVVTTEPACNGSYSHSMTTYDEIPNAFGDCKWAPSGCTGNLTINSSRSGYYTDGTLEVWLTPIGENGFEWVSNFAPCYMIVKTGGGSTVAAYGYNLGQGYNCGSWPGNESAVGAGMSHITFCYDPGTTTTTAATTTTTLPTTTTTTDDSTTTTTEATTTTTLPTTTTTEATTTTTLPTTTTTESTTTTTLPTTTTTESTTTTTEGDTTTTTEGDTTTTTKGKTTTTTEGKTTTTTESTTTTVPSIEVLALTGFNSLWYVIGSILIGLGVIVGTYSLSTSFRRR